MQSSRETSIRLTKPKWSKNEMCCAKLLSCPTLCNPMDYSPPGSSVHGDSPGKNAGVGCHSLLQGSFPTQGLNPDLLHCRQTLYHLSYEGSGKESACQCRRPGFDPWSRKMPHAEKQLSPCATTLERVLQSPGTTNTEAWEPWLLSQHTLEPVLCNQRSHLNEKPTHCK